MASKYNASHFIRKFKDIPDAHWTTRAYCEGGKHCALGHLGAPRDNYLEVMGLVRLFKKYLATNPARVNDGDDIRFNVEGHTAKDRVMSALQKIRSIRRSAQ